MFKRIIDRVKSLFHEETPEEQDKRIHETIKSWKENVDKMELQRIDAYLAYCESQFELTRLLKGQQEMSAVHLALWDDALPRIKNRENALGAWSRWHAAHLILASLYCFDVPYPPDDPRFGQIKEHVDIRPVKWLKDLANEEKIIKALQMEANAKQYQV